MNTNTDGKNTGHENVLEGKTGDAFDKAFLLYMKVHHQDAVDMAQAVLKKAKHEELKEMAQDVISAQSGEIRQIETWLKEWYGEHALSSSVNQ